MCAKLGHFVQAPEKLEELSLSHSRLGEGFEVVGTLRKLRRLCLTGTRVADEDVAVLGDISTLCEIWVDGTQVTADGVEQLSHALPTCRVIWEPSRLPVRQE